MQLPPTASYAPGGTFGSSFLDFTTLAFPPWTGPVPLIPFPPPVGYPTARFFPGVGPANPFPAPKLSQRELLNPVELCPWLVPNPIEFQFPHVKWDMSLLPTTAKRMSGTGVIYSLRDKFNDLATHPPVKHIQIIIPAGPAEPQGLGLLWPNLVIKKETNITLGDILYAIYDFLNKSMSDAEVSQAKHRLETAKQYYPHYESLEYAARQRAKVSQEIHAVGGSGRPFRRIDCMGTGQRFFFGLLLTYSQGGSDSRWWLVLYGQPQPTW